MSRFESITIREVESSDLETFYEHQVDPEAIRMAAFVCEDPKDKVAFDAHWDKILNSSQNITRTVVAQGQVAGYMACYPHGENMEVNLLAWKGGLGKRISDSSAQQDARPCCRSADFRQGGCGQYRVDKSAAEMRF